MGPCVRIFQFTNVICLVIDFHYLRFSFLSFLCCFCLVTLIENTFILFLYRECFICYLFVIYLFI